MRLSWVILSGSLFCTSSAVAQQSETPRDTAPKSPVGKITNKGVWICDRAEALDVPIKGPFARRKDGRLLCVYQNTAHISSDEGRTWKKLATVVEDESRFLLNVGRDIVRTQKGTIIVPFSNDRRQKWVWKPQLWDAPNATGETGVVRSRNDGKTWLKPQILHDKFTGDNSAIIQTKKGRVVMATMKWLHNPGRHGVLTYYSDDDGDSWRASHVIDLGGRGHHSGTIEAALEELKDGRLWLLIRTNWGKFWNAYSRDGGSSWRTIYPSTIDASSSPGFLRRLKSGRIVLVWNRYYKQNSFDVPLRGGDDDWSDTETSWQREELSMALSHDDGRRWTDPVVIARKPGGDLSYPNVFESSAGRLWITAGAARLTINEADFVPPKKPK